MIQYRVAIAVHGQTKGKQNNDGVDNGAEIEANDDRPVERLVLHGDKLPLAATTVCSRRLLTEGLIALDVAGSQLQNSGLQAIVAWTPWLRGLSAAGDCCEVLKDTSTVFRARPCYQTKWYSYLSSKDRSIVE